MTKGHRMFALIISLMLAPIMPVTLDSAADEANWRDCVTQSNYSDYELHACDDQFGDNWRM